jgi:hypothetical protein
MKKILHVILISLFILTVNSCAKKSDDSSSSSTSIELFIAVGGSGTILTSPDGTTWTAQTSGTSNDLRSVAYDGSSTIVAVGFSGTILTSSDGTTWTSRTSGTSININNVAYGNNQFVVVGDNGTTLYSSDGITWTDWTSSCGANDNESLWDVAYGSSAWVTVGDNGSIYSLDESSCTKRTSGTTVEFNELIYGNSIFAAIGDNATILTSSDGTTWTYSCCSNNTNNLYGGYYSVTASGSKIHTTVGQSGIIAWSSNNGSSWGSWDASITTNILGIAHGAGTQVFVGSSGTIYTAADGVDDATARTSGTTNYLRRVFYIE